MKVVIILPTYNERENIITLLESISLVTTKITNHSFSYLVVDDNSPDGTQQEVIKYQKKHKHVLLLTGKKEGLGKALLRGMKYAVDTLHAEIIMQMDADLSHDPASLPEFLKAIDKGADFVVGSRYIQGGSIPSNWGLHRKIYSIVGNGIVRYGLGYSLVHDWTGGYRAFRRKFYESMKERMAKYRGYLFQIAFLHKSLIHNARVAEVPIHFTDRRFGRSKIAPSEYIRDVLAYVATERLRSLVTGSFGKFLVVGTIGFIINTVVLEIMVSFGYHPSLGSAAGAELAIISNFVLNNTWTFSHRKIAREQVFWKFLQFNGTSLGAVVIQTLSVSFGTIVYGVQSYRLFYILGVGVALIWNYTMYSKVIWKR